MVLWVYLRPDWQCRWFYGCTEGLCGGVAGSMGVLKVCVAEVRTGHKTNRINRH